MVRQALDDAVGCESLSPSDSFTLAMEYSNVDAGARGFARLDPGADTSLVVLARHRRHEPDPGASPDALRRPGGPGAASRSGAVG